MYHMFCHCSSQALPCLWWDAVFLLHPGVQGCGLFKEVFDGFPLVALLHICWHCCLHLCSVATIMVIGCKDGDEFGLKRLSKTNFHVTRQAIMYRIEFCKKEQHCNMYTEALKITSSECSAGCEKVASEASAARRTKFEILENQILTKI